MKRISAIILFTIFHLAGCAVTNRYDAYSGKVVESGTKKPIEGAVVLVVYLTQQYTLAGANSQYADAQEVVTDRNGEFRIPAKRIFTFRILSGWERYPLFTIFKPGYGCYPNHRGVKPMFIPNGTLPSNRSVIVELPSVINEPVQERVRNAACLPGPSVPAREYRKLSQLLDEEYKLLGY